MIVSDLLQQYCNKSDNINKVLQIVNCLFQTCCLFQTLLTTWDNLCEDNLFADLVQDVRLLRV
jgi:hypothetical protein